MARVEMAFSAIEKSIDKDGNCTGATVPYIVFGANDEDGALAAVKGAAASAMGFGAGASVPLASIEIDERVNATTYRVSATYEKPPSTSARPDDPGTGGGEEQVADFSFETSGGTRHLVQSRGTSKHPSNAPSYGGAIGVDSDGTVHGVDITMPTLTFAETKVLNSVSTSSIKTLSNLTGKTTSGGFKGFSKGEVLFLGASGGRRSDGKWEISYKFSVSPNESNFSVGGISAGSKSGWEYAWVRYEDSVDGNAVARKPVAVYVERVYDSADFGSLGL